MDFFCDRNKCRFSLYSRVQRLLESSEWSDCTFVVGDQRFPVHRLIMSISSPVFQAMLYGPLSQTGDIVVKDIQPDTFHRMINYIYTDEIAIDNIDEAFSLLYASKKYMMEYLVEKSQIFISENLSIDNAFIVFKLAGWLQEPNLYLSSVNLICQHADTVLKNDIQEIPAMCLKAVLHSDKINMTEFDLFQRTFLWAHHYCVTHNIEPTPQNKKKVLTEKGMLKQLRIFCLSHREFDMMQDLQYFLTESELTFVSETLLKLDRAKELPVSVPNHETFPFDDTASFRKEIDLQWFHCRRALVRTSKPIIVTNSSNSVNVKIKCSKTVFVRSFAIPTQMSPNLKFKHAEQVYKNYRENIDVTIYSNKDSQEKFKTRYDNTVPYNTTTFIDFPDPQKLLKDEWYNIIFEWHTSSCSSLTYPASYRHLTWNHKVLFNFEDDKGSECPTFLEGLKFCV